MFAMFGYHWLTNNLEFPVLAFAVMIIHETEGNELPVAFRLYKELSLTQVGTYPSAFSVHFKHHEYMSKVFAIREKRVQEGVNLKISPSLLT